MPKYPAIHNAMWPGLVGKGARCRAADRSRHDARSDRRGERQRHEVRRRRSVPLRSARQHRFDRRRPEEARRQDRASATSSSARWSRRCGRRRAADRRWAARRSAELPDAGAQGLRDRQEAQGPRHPQVRRRPHRLGGEPGRLGQGSGRAIRRGSPRRSARRATSPRTTASGWPPKGKSAGAACTAGSATSSSSSWSTVRRRSASRPTWRTRCSSRSATTRRRIASCPRTTTGRIQQTLDDALKTMTRALRPWTIDFHVAQNDATVKGSGSHDKTGRHCLPNDPNGKLDIVRHAGYWLRDDTGSRHARARAHLLGRLHVPERDDDAGEHLERRPRRDGRRAQRARVGLKSDSGRSWHDADAAMSSTERMLGYSYDLVTCPSRHRVQSRRPVCSCEQRL